MRIRVFSSAVGYAVGLLVVTFASSLPVQAAVCPARQSECVSTLTKRLIRCHFRAEKAGTVVDPECLAKAQAKFNQPTRGCLARAQKAGDCVIEDVPGALDLAVTDLIDDIVPALNPFHPDPIPGGNACAAKKKLCVAKRTRKLLACHAQAARRNVPVDAACIQKAEDSFDGGSSPEKGCFAKLESKGGCLTVGDAGAIEAVLDAFVDEMSTCFGVPSSCTATTTTSTTSTTLGSVPCPQGGSAQACLAFVDGEETEPVPPCRAQCVADVDCLNACIDAGLCGDPTLNDACSAAINAAGAPCCF